MIAGVIILTCPHLTSCFMQLSENWYRNSLVGNFWWDIPKLRDYYTLSNKNPSAWNFLKSRTGSDVRYGCHHNSSRFTFPIFAHSWRFSVFHSVQSITLHMY